MIEAAGSTESFWEKEKRESVSFLAKIGIQDARELYDGWSSDREHDSGPSNVYVLRGLEKQTPGIGALLHGYYGIRNFGRYPHELLTFQAVHHDTDMPYGVVATANDDYGPSFQPVYGGSAPYVGFQHTLMGIERKTAGAPPRFVEAKTSRELVRHTLQLDKKFGVKNKFSYFILRGHGDAESIFLNGDDTIEKADVESLHDHEGQNFFEQNGVLILESCATGRERGIAQAISKKFGITVLAPQENAATSSIDFSTPIPTVEFIRGAGDGSPVKTMRYERGVLQV